MEAARSTNIGGREAKGTDKRTEAQIWVEMLSFRIRASFLN